MTVSLWLGPGTLSLTLLGKIQVSSRQMVLCQLITFSPSAKAAGFEIKIREIVGLVINQNFIMKSMRGKDRKRTTRREQQENSLNFT